MTKVRFIGLDVHTDTMAVAVALEDRERIRAMGSASRERAESLLNWDRVARPVVEHIDATAHFPT